MKALLIACLSLMLVSCGREQGGEDHAGDPLRIAVAANAQYATDALVEAFSAHTGIAARTIVSSSGKLTAQIQQSAPFDLFLSADMDYPHHLYEQGLAATEPAIYAYGELILWTTDTLLDLSDPRAALLDPAVRRIAIAQARTAPYGRAAEAWLAREDIRPRLAEKLVFGESIAQVNSYLLSGAAQVAFTALSVVLAPELAQKGHYLRLDPATYPPLAQGMIITRYGEEQHPTAAQAFFQFVFSPEGQEILRQFGYRSGSSVPSPDHGEQ
jgi:molybdate transport system substrate-binding protein